MGWWKVQNTEDVIGDAPLDVLTGAMAEIVSQYEASFQRRPTKEEWEALLTAVLGEEEAETQPISGATVSRVVIELG